MPKTSRSEKMDFKGLEIIADEFTGAMSNPAVAAIVKVTNSTGGTVSNTAAVVPAAVAAATGADTATLPTLISVNASITAIKNDLAVAVAKINEILNALD